MLVSTPEIPLYSKDSLPLGSHIRFRKENKEKGRDNAANFAAFKWFQQLRYLLFPFLSTRSYTNRSLAIIVRALG